MPSRSDEEGFIVLDRKQFTALATFDNELSGETEGESGALLGTCP